MRPEHRPGKGPYLLLVLLLAVLLPSGCFDRPQEFAIPPSGEAQGQGDVGLGPGIRSLSSGPGEKGSPSWSPSGERIAFTVDDYVVQKEPGARDFERQTTRDFDAQTVSWSQSGDSLTILGADGKSRPADTRFSPVSLGLYSTAASGGSMKVSRIANGVRAMVSGPPESGWTLLATDGGDSLTRLAIAEPRGVVRPYATKVEGEVTGLSISPDGDQAVLAARTSASPARYELYTFSLSEETLQPIAQLDEGMEVLGDPQWTESGVYYVAGETRTERESAAPYDLYRVPSDSPAPELVTGVGGDFVASNVKRDPKGEQLAVVGRRNPGSAENLYVFDLASEKLEAVTSNEEMQIKTGAGDIAWSVDGSSIVIVARASLTEPKVYAAPADTLVEDFYNLYEVPVGETVGGG